MKLVIIGYGKMGKRVEKLALAMGHQVTSIISPSRHNTNELEALVTNADVAIDFSTPDSVPQTITRLLPLQKPLVVGTTGWDLTTLSTTIKNSGCPFLYGANFSLGMQLFLKLIEKTAPWLESFETHILEEHHKEKKDTPSGTSLAIAQKLQINTPITSVRLGTTIGTHRVLFDHPFEQIELTHRAKNRDSFAKGAIEAASWLQNKQGFFTVEDMIDGLI